MSRHPWFALFFVILAVSTIIVSGCKDDDPISSNPTDNDHAEAEGLILRLNGVSIVTVDSGVVTGEIEIGLGEETDLIRTRFIDPDGDEFVPSVDHHRISIVIADTSIAEYEQHTGEAWDFHIIGKQAGETSVVIGVLHGDHLDFRTPVIPIHVEQEPVGLIFVNPATHDTVRVNAGTVTGAVNVPNNSTVNFNVQFVDQSGGFFTPEVEEGHSLGWVIGDTTIVSGSQPGSEPWTLAMQGRSAGQTTIVLRLLHNGHSDYSTPQLPVTVP
ncbi:MAG: hypothetical protein OEM52_03415 [bacterium]|nr:hypothetical protein [bacterium]